MDWRTRGRWKVHPGVRRTGLAIQDAAAAEICAGSYANERNPKCALPQFIGSYGGVDFAQALLLSLGARQLLRIGFDELWGDLEAFSGELPGRHMDTELAGSRWALFSLEIYIEGVIPWGFFEVDGDERMPGLGPTFVFGCRCRVRSALPEGNTLGVPFGVHIRKRNFR